MIIFFWLLFGLGINFFINNNATPKIIYSNMRSPEDMLMERYINGEIDTVTFEKMKMTMKR